jgi:hypothetical protein
LATSDDQLRFLGDVIPVPDPVMQAVSIGDVLIYGGVGIAVVAAMRGVRTRRDELLDDAEVAHAGG